MDASSINQYDPKTDTFTRVHITSDDWQAHSKEIRQALLDTEAAYNKTKAANFVGIRCSVDFGLIAKFQKEFDVPDWYPSYCQDLTIMMLS